MAEEQDKKLFIDDDWKNQAEKEREELAQEFEKGKEAETSRREVNFLVHLESLVVQAMMSMGMIEHPMAEGKRIFDPVQARYFIDSIVMLKEKTAGNLSSEEEAYLSKILPELQMSFLEVSKMATKQGASPSQEGAKPEGEGPGEASSIIMP